jgi:hypothetical protein
MRRTLTEILAFVAVSAIITAGTAVIGRWLLSPATTPPLPSDAGSGSCVDEPFTPLRGFTFSSGVGTLARLCFGVADVRPRLELTGVRSGTVFSAWLTNEEHPKTEHRARCDLPPPDAGAAWTRPVRIGAAVADQTGRLHLSATMRDLRIVGGARLQIVAVDHGWTRPERGVALADELIDWEPAWGRGSAAPTGDSHHRGQMVGCASFWLRGGVDSLEN